MKHNPIKRKALNPRKIIQFRNDLLNRENELKLQHHENLTEAFLQQCMFHVMDMYARWHESKFDCQFPIADVHLQVELKR